MSIFLLLQATYHTYEIAIFSGSACVDTIIEDKKYSSRDLMLSIHAILERNALPLSTMSAFGINQGPGPFTSLRVIVTTANGLGFATGIPLIGINSIEALLLEYADERWPLTVALLNAFNNDLYYGIQSLHGLEIGCENNEKLFMQLKERFFNQTIRFLGGGAALYRNQIEKVFGNNGVIQNPLAEHCSLQQLGLMTAAAYQKKELCSEQLLPIYLKDMRYTVQM